MVDFEDSNTRALSCCVCVFFITGVILFSVSFDTLEPTEIGLRYNNNFKTLERDRVYNGGRYFLGLGQKFIKFPAHFVLINFSGTGENGQIHAWSKEGQAVLLDVSFMYRIQRDKAASIYDKYRTGYDDIIRKIAVETIKQVSIEFTTEQFFLVRRLIGREMKNALWQRLRLESLDIELFNLRGIDLPDKFEQKIVDKVVQAQEYNTALNVKAAQIRRAEVSVIQGNAQTNVTLNLAVANATSYRLIEAARSSRFEKLRKQEATSFQTLKTSLNLTDNNLLQYRYSQLARDLSDVRTASKLQFIIGFNTPLISVKTN